jgi:hypothetical protein
MEDVFQSHAPRFFPKVLEDRDKGRGDEISFFAILGFKDVEANGKIGIGRIEIHDFVRTARWDEMQKVFDQLSVRVYDTYAVAATDVLYRHVLQEGTLARARLSDDIDVMPAVIRLDAKLDAARVRGGFPQRQYFQNKKGLLTLIFYSLFH